MAETPLRNHPPARARDMVLAIGMGLALVAPGPAAAVERDYGDAPDGAHARYLTKPTVIGHFPAKESSDGARHSVTGQLRLGRSVDSEGDSRQVNRDRHDDGFFVGLGSCRTSTLTFIVDASGLPASLRASGHTAYLNTWFDWNQDGDWRDADRCGKESVPEHRMQNLPLDMGSFASDALQAIQVKVKAGQEVTDIWYRASLTLDEPFTLTDGRGSFAHGETEDYKQQRRPEEKKKKKKKKGGGGGGASPVGSCRPNPGFVLHGQATTLSVIGASSKLVGKKAPPGVEISVQPGRKVKIKSKRIDGPKRSELVTLTFQVQLGKVVRRFRCTVRIFHGQVRSEGVAPRQQPGQPPPAIPRPITQACQVSTKLLQGDSNKYVIEGQCQIPFSKITVIVDGRSITSFSAHSPSCSFSATALPNDTLTCTGKPDGRICIILGTSGPPAVGMKTRVRIEFPDGNVHEVDLFANPAGPACSLGP